MTTNIVPPAENVQATPRETSSRDSAARIPELDGLRGTAILLVILCHYINGTAHEALSPWLRRAISAANVGWSGVDLFFVLSGFLIGGILLEARESPNYFRTFYTRRVFRILPIYYTWTLLFGVVVLVASQFPSVNAGVTLHMLLRIPIQLLFLQNVFVGMALFPWTWFAVTWSLAVEEQFYLLAPPLIRYVKRQTLVTILTGLVFLAPVLRVLALRYLNDGASLAEFAMPCRADALAWGMLLALGWREEWFREFARQNKRKLLVALAILLAGVGVLLWWLVQPMNGVRAAIGYSWLAVLYAVLLLVVISQTEGWIAGVMRWKWLRWLGGISYCVYILHESFNLFAHRALLHAGPEIYDLKGIAVSLLALAATLAVASLSWRYFEKPLIRRGHTYYYG